MRLRLHILRNELPALKVVWNTASLKSGADPIVSNLLDSVDAVIPLESHKWGLEDYVVELAGFEVLHFQELDAVFKEDDEVVIRPLSSTEVKQRRLSGRRQISSSGRKLLDGTPFGRPLIRQAPDRPQILIPSTKRRKAGRGVETSTLQLESEDEGEEDEDEPVFDEDTDEENDLIATSRNALVRFASTEIPDSEDDEDDSDFETQVSGSETETELGSKGGEEEEEEEEFRISDDEVNANAPTLGVEPNSKEFSEVSKPHGSSSTSHSSESEGDESSSNSSSSKSESSSDSSSSESESSSDESSDESNSEEFRSPKRAKIEPPKPAHHPQTTFTAKGLATALGTLPYQASSATSARNRRKKHINLLKQLQNEKLVDENCSLTRLKEYLAEMSIHMNAPAGVILRALREKQQAEIATDNARDKMTEAPKEKKAVDDQNIQPSVLTNSGGNHITKGQRRAFKKAVQAGNAQPGSFTQWLQSQGDQQSCNSTLSLEERRKGATPASHQSATEVTQPENLGLNTYGKSNKKWKQLRNKAPTKMIFDDDGNVVEAKELDMPILREPEYEPTAPKKSADPNAWCSKIWLSAVECEEDGVTLPIPNFPFKQGQLQGGMNPGKKRKRDNKERRQAHCDDYQEGDVIMLDYGDDPTVKLSKTTAAEDGDLPMLPADMSNLEPLTLPVLPGTIVAFKRFAINYKTMTPQITDYLTAIVENVHAEITDGPLLELRLSVRDRVQPEYDETGDRIVGKFDMPGYEKEEETGYLEMMYGELLEAKILKLPEGGAEFELEKKEPAEKAPEEKDAEDQGQKHGGEIGLPDPEGDVDGGDDTYMGDGESAYEPEDPAGDEVGEHALPVVEKVPQEQQSQYDFIPFGQSFDDRAGEDEKEEQPVKELTPVLEKLLTPAPLTPVPVVEKRLTPAPPTPSPAPPINTHTHDSVPPRIPTPTPLPEKSPTPTPAPQRHNEPKNQTLERGVKGEKGQKGEKTKSQVPVYEIPTDSDDDLPRLGTILSQFSSQPPKVKKEPPYMLPSLPEFSPLGVKVDEAQRQVLTEAAHSSVKKPAGQNRKKVEVIELSSSSPERS